MGLSGRAVGGPAPLLAFMFVLVAVPLTLASIQARVAGEVKGLGLDHEGEGFGGVLSSSLESIYAAASHYGYGRITRLLAAGFAGLPLLPECGVYRAASVAGGWYDSVYAALNEYRNLVEGLEKDLGIRLPHLSYREIRRLMGLAGRGAVEALQTLCGLARDYNSLVRAAGLVLVRGDDLARSWFYDNLTRFLLDIVLIRLDPTYSLASRIVGKTFTSTGLASLILKYGGYTALEYSMSLSHWKLRHKIAEIIEENKDNPGRILHRLQEILNR